MKKDVVAGLGEIGSTILKLLSKKQITVGYDLDKKLVDESKLKKYEDITTSFLKGKGRGPERSVLHFYETQQEHNNIVLGFHRAWHRRSALH